ncbi:MAG: RagB/SusD family nutrient uptake outer membrane protein, partial [Butyricimonas virosa]
NYSTFVSDLFDGNANDLRLKQQWSYLRSYTGQYVRITRKYDDMYPSNSSAARNMPLVRLAEMYLILMEVGTLEEANVAYETLCAARGVDYVALTESDRTDRVLMEWIRELIAEGQNFYTYKRFAVKRMLWQDAETADCGEEQYVLPLPPSERR